MGFRLSSFRALPFLGSPGSFGPAAPAPHAGASGLSGVCVVRAAPLTCEQARPADLQLEAELVFHGVAHVGVQESRQAQLVPGVQGPGAEAMPVFAGKGPRGGQGGSQGQGQGRAA